jgi:hypothetical protein
MPAGTDCAPVSGIDRLHGVRGADHSLYLDVVVQERHELAPEVLLEPGDRRVLGTPFRGEFDEAFLGPGLGGCGVDRADVLGDLIQYSRSEKCCATDESRIALVGRGGAPHDDGSSVFVDVDVLRTTANHHLITQGWRTRRITGLCSRICATN